MGWVYRSIMTGVSQISYTVLSGGELTSTPGGGGIWVGVGVNVNVGVSVGVNVGVNVEVLVAVGVLVLVAVGGCVLVAVAGVTAVGANVRVAVGGGLVKVTVGPVVAVLPEIVGGSVLVVRGIAATRVGSISVGINVGRGVACDVIWIAVAGGMMVILSINSICQGTCSS